jgi:hypothetical protein
MPVTVALQLDVRDLRPPRLVADVILELLELQFAAEEFCPPDVQFGDLGGIEDESHG